VNRLAGRTDVEDALVRLDGLTALMAAAEGLKIVRGVDDNVKMRVKMPGVVDKVAGSEKQVDDAQGVALGDIVRGVEDDALDFTGGAQFVFNQSSIRF
jgi:hypothetical protein